VSATPLRVQVVIDSMTAGGAEMLLGDFAVGAPAAGIDLSVCYLTAHDEGLAAARLRRRGIEPVHVHIDSLIKPASVRRVRSHLEATDPDLVHTHLSYSDALGGLAARMLGVPVVSTLHVMERERHLRDRVRERLMATARRRSAARVICVSDAARGAFLQATRYPAGRVVTVHNGIAVEPLPGAGAAVRAELGLSPDDLVVGMLGVLRPGKGHDEAAAAVARLRRAFPGLRLVVAGDGPSREAVARAMAPLGEAAVLAGHRGDVMAVLDAVDILLHPSKVEAFPTAVLEAMAAGVPVVASAVGGIPEILADGETGVLVPPPAAELALADALEPLLQAPDVRRAMAERGRERMLREFTAERWAERTRAVYDEVLDR
jgi:glycosyltransferase involved in cell wall biosynthesis